MGDNENKEEEFTDSVPLDFGKLQHQTWTEMRDFVTRRNFHKYDQDDVEAYLVNPEYNSRQLREVSKHLFSNSGYYMRIVFYLARMLTLDHIVTPIGITNEQAKSDEFKEQYNKAVNYMDDFNVKHELNKVLITMISEDVYFGYERKVGRSSTLQRLPTDFCRIIGMEDGLYTFAFDMSYFDGNRKKLRSYDIDFFRLYKEYKRTGNRYQPLDTDKAVCFKFREDIFYSMPPFAMVFREVMDTEDSKELVKTKNVLENFKLLLQKIPFKKDPRSQNDFIITMDSVKMFHDAIKKSLPESIGLISSPMDIEDFSFERKNNAISDNLKESKEDFYDSIGMTSSIFNAGGKSSIAIIKSIQSNESLMFAVLRQFERFFKRRVRQVVSSDYSFDVMFPDLTVYNRDEMFDRYLTMAQYGYPKSLVGAAVGLSMSQLQGMNMLENDCLGLTHDLEPLQSSHTMSGDKSDAGANEKSDSQLSDKGIETRDDGTNTISKEIK